MFVELFETIYNHMWEFLLGVGLSAGTIYLIFNLIKGLCFCVFQKKKRQLQSKQNNQTIIEETVKGVMEVLLPNLETILENQDRIIEQQNTLLQAINSKTDEEVKSLAIEFEAYQKTMLSQDVNLQLLYEQTKSMLISLSKQAKPAIEEVADTTSQIANNLTEAIVENEDKIMESVEDVSDTVKAVKNTAKKVKNKIKNVSYE